MTPSFNPSSIFINYQRYYRKTILILYQWMIKPFFTDEFPKDCSSKHLSTTKWKRERRSRLPEYSRADSRNGEASNGNYHNQPSPENLTNGFSARVQQKETPLDMSVRQRGLPPSYAQTVSNPGYRSNYRPAAALNNGPPPTKEEIPAGVNRINGIVYIFF